MVDAAPKHKPNPRAVKYAKLRAKRLKNTGSPHPLHEQRRFARRHA